MKLLSKKKSPSWDQSDTKVLSSMAAVRRGRVHFELVSGVHCTSEWSPLHQQAFDNAKAAIAGAQLLSYLNYELPILLRTDACDDGGGATLTRWLMDHDG